MTLATAFQPTSRATYALEALDTERQPVLVALKPYDGCDAALAVAQWLAGISSGRCTPSRSSSRMRWWRSPPASPPARALLPRRARGDRRPARDAVGAHAVQCDTTRRIDVAQGPAALTVADVARERAVHAIVVGTGQHGPLGRLVYGERAVQIARLAERPVVVVPPRAAAGPVAEAIVAVDFSPASQRAARFAMEMLADGGRLALVHVKSAVNLSEEGAGWWDDAYERRTTDLFRQLVASLRPERGITIATQMLHGEPAPALLAYAREHEAGLIACGGRRHSFIERMLLGSVSTDLIRHAVCTVVVMPDRAHEPEAQMLPALGGVVESWDANAWPGLIERFGRRNAGRATQLRYKTASPQGAGSVESGYRLVDASFDRAASRAEIVLRDREMDGLQLSHRISNVRGVMVSTDAKGRDTALRLDTANGRCTLVVGE